MGFAAGCCCCWLQELTLVSKQRLDALIGYCEAPCCRRQILLTYFGETARPCGNCDICLDQAPRSDGTAEAQLIRKLSTLLRIAAGLIEREFGGFTPPPI